jgi:TonB family protein
MTYALASTRGAIRAFIALFGILLGVLAPPVAQAQAAGGGAEAAQLASKLTRPPELLQFVEAEYPDSERASGRSAAVVLQITISATGAVDEVSVSESAGPAFDEAALAAARQFVFRPAEIDGLPAPIRILYRYEFVLRVAAPTSAVFVGSVRNRDTHAPLPNVTVALDSGASAVTDASGRFQIPEVSPGAHAVTLSGEQLTALRTEETFVAGQQLDATYDVQLESPAVAGEPSEDLEIVVVAPALRKQVVSTEVSAEQARKVPGTQGDVLRVVENLPGVARSSVGSGQLVVWGSAPEDTRVYVDGVRVPRLYHNGGLRSVISSDFVQSVDLVPGGYGAAFGRGLGGLVTVSTRPIDGPGTHGSLAIDVLDASGAVRAPITDKLHFALAARRSHLSEVVSAVTDRSVEDYFPIPRYHDGQARLRYQLSKTDSLELTGLLSSDHILRTLVAADPARTARESRDIDFQRVYLGYRAQLDDGSSVVFTPFFGFDASKLANRVGTTPTDLSNDTMLGGLRTSWRKKSFDWLTVELGLDAEIARASLRRSGSIGAPPREGDVRVFGQPPPDQINIDDWRAVLVGMAPYVEADVALVDDKLHIYTGLRADPNLVSVSRRLPPQGNSPPVGLTQQDFALEPRLAVRYAFSSRFAVKTAYGAYHQPPQVEDLSATFGNPTLKTARADHVLLGATLGITDTLSVELTGFYAKSSDLAVRSPLSSPLIAQALVQKGEGQAFGSQVLVRQELSKHFFGWLSYSLLRSERRASDQAGWRPFDYDQTHILTALASYDLGAGFEIGVRFRYATGFPRTEVIGAFYDASRDLFQPRFGEHNALRIPAFLELDVRIEKRFVIAGTELNAYLELQNATDRKNPEEIVYNNDYSGRKYITGLPILPVVGVRWTF